MKTDKDLKIGISTEYDGSGAAKALEDMDKLKAAPSTTALPTGSPAASSGGAAAGAEDLAKAEEHAAEASEHAAEAAEDLGEARSESTGATKAAATAEEESATATTAASERAKAASDKEKEARAAKMRMMALESLTRKELTNVIETLTKRQKEAAAANNGKAYTALAREIGEAKNALARMNQAQAINTTAMATQAQMGMQVGATLKGLAADCKAGTLSVSGLAQGFLALSSAVKAGMGPIGWVMLAIQGLEMAWNLYSSSQEEARKKERERMEAEQEALEKHMEAVDKMANLERGNAVAKLKKDFEDLGKEQEKQEKERQEAAKRAAIAAGEEEAKRRTAAEARYQQELATIGAAEAAGQMTAAEAERRKRAAEEAKETELAAVEETAKARENAARLDDARAAEAQAEALQKALDAKSAEFGNVLTVKLPTPDEWEALEIKLKEGMASTEEVAFSKEVHDQMNEVRAALEAMGVAWTGTDAELVKFVQQLKDAGQAQQEKIDALRDQAATARVEAADMAAQYRQQKEQAAASAQTRKAQAETAAAQRAQARVNEEWTLVQRGSLKEQEAWLQSTVSHMAAGSEEAKKWAEQLHQVRNRRLQEELGKLGDTFKVTGSYAEEDRRTQYRILQDDKKALAARAKRLQSMLEEAQDDATRQQISKALKDTMKQQRGLAQAEARNAAAARAMLKNYKAPKLHDKNRMVERNLNALARAYARATRLAGQAAGKGNGKAVERYNNMRTKLAARLAKHDSHFASRKKKDDDAILAATRKQAQNAKKNSKTTASKTDKKLEDEKKKQLSATKKKTASLKKDAKTGASKSKDNGARLRSLEAQVKNMNAEKAKEGQAISSLAAAVTTLANQASQAAGAAAGAAGACAKATKSLGKQIANCQKQINRLMKEI